MKGQTDKSVLFAYTQENDFVLFDSILCDLYEVDC